MNKLLFAGCALLCVASVSSALAQVSYTDTSPSGERITVPVTPSKPLPVTGGSGGGSLSAKANAAAPTSTEGATTDPLSMTLFRGLRVVQQDPLTGADVSLLDQRPVSVTLSAADVATSSASGMGGVSIVTGAPTANSTADIAVNGQAAAGVTVSGSGTWTGVLEESFDGGGSSGHYVTVSAVQAGPTENIVPSITGSALLGVVVNHATNLRFRLTSLSSGTPVVQFNFSGAPGLTKITNPVSSNCLAKTASPTAVTDGSPVTNLCGVEGKQIFLPYAIKELQVRGTATSTDTSAHTIIAAGGASIKTYVTGAQCYNTSATTVTVAFDDGASTTIIVPAGGGNNIVYPVPLVTAANTAFTFTSSTGQTTVGCSAQGYTGA